MSKQDDGKQMKQSKAEKTNWQTSPEPSNNLQQTDPPIESGSEEFKTRPKIVDTVSPTSTPIVKSAGLTPEETKPKIPADPNLNLEAFFPEVFPPPKEKPIEDATKLKEATPIVKLPLNSEANQKAEKVPTKSDSVKSNKLPKTVDTLSPTPKVESAILTPKEDTPKLMSYVVLNPEVEQKAEKVPLKKEIEKINTVDTLPPTPTPIVKSAGLTPEEAKPKIIANPTLNPEAKELLTPAVPPKEKGIELSVTNVAKKFIPRFSFGFTPDEALAKVRANSIESLPWWASSLKLPYGTTETIFEISNRWNGSESVYGYICRSGKESTGANASNLESIPATINVDPDLLGIVSGKVANLTKKFEASGFDVNKKYLEKKTTLRAQENIGPQIYFPEPTQASPPTPEDPDAPPPRGNVARLAKLLDLKINQQQQDRKKNEVHHSSENISKWVKMFGSQDQNRRH